MVLFFIVLIFVISVFVDWKFLIIEWVVEVGVFFESVYWIV